MKELTYYQQLIIAVIVGVIFIVAHLFVICRGVTNFRKIKKLLNERDANSSFAGIDDV